MEIKTVVRMDVTQTKFVIFDVGQTLLFLTPPSEEVLLARCQQLAVEVELEDLKRGCKVGELWTAQTIMQEQQGAPNMRRNFAPIGLINSRTWWVAPVSVPILSTHDDPFSIPTKRGLDIRRAIA